MQNPDVRHVLATLPTTPGVYKYLNAEGRVIYVGKAKNLKKRVASYFRKNPGGRVSVIVKNIQTVDYVVVDSEVDALLLENNLIKEYKPRYNILLKDDKSFPWICIRREPFARVFKTRKKRKDGSKYYGPFPNVTVADALIDLTQEMYPVHTANYKIDATNYPRSIFRSRLEHYMDHRGLTTETPEEVYQTIILEVEHILKGSFGKLQEKLLAQMLHLSEQLEFEKAHFIKQKMNLIQKYQAKSIVVSPTLDDLDVFSFLEDENKMFVNHLHVKSGSIMQSYTTEVKNTRETSLKETFVHAILFIREKMHSNAKEIIVPIDLDYSEIKGAKVIQPKIGDKKKLLDLSLKNASYYRLDKIKKQKLLDPGGYAQDLLLKMQSDLRLSEPPHHIECFDNSNIQGAHPVSACVVFRDAKPSTSEYRKFNIRTVEGIDDFGSMIEVVSRRYKRLLAEGRSLPQVIVIDGGKGQLNSAHSALVALGIEHKVAIISIAKRLEEICFFGDAVPLYLDKRSETLRIIQQLRNEAHRFSITHHRQKRSKATIQTELSQIPDIGDQTVLKLLKKYGSVTAVAKANFEDLCLCIGKARAEKVHTFFKE